MAAAAAEIVAVVAVAETAVVVVAANAVSVGQDGIEHFSFPSHAPVNEPAHCRGCWSTHPIEPNSTRTILDGDVSAPFVRVTAFRL
jgi:hypothetical protein